MYSAIRSYGVYQEPMKKNSISYLLFFMGSCVFIIEQFCALGTRERYFDRDFPSVLRNFISHYPCGRLCYIVHSIGVLTVPLTVNVMVCDMHSDRVALFTPNDREFE